MIDLKGKTVFITGASSGIGKECAKIYARNGINLILTARRFEKLEELKKELSVFNVNIDIYELDVKERDSVKKLIESLNITPHILINNAGLASGLSKMQDGDFEDWDAMIDTNLKGLLNVSRFMIPKMIKENKGHIINIGSIAGHQVYQNGNVYNATKFAVNALNQAMNLDLNGTNIRVSSIDPGAVETEFSIVRFHGDIEKANNVYKGFTPLKPEDIANIIYFVTTLDEHINIQNILVTPTAQRNITTIHKEL